MKQKYKVTVSRISYSARTIEVEAESDIEAYDKALDEAGNYEFSESNADYEVESIEAINP